MYIGLDIGFGFTKVTDGHNRYIIPSLATRTAFSDKSFSVNEDSVFVNDVEYAVGSEVSSTGNVSKDFVGSDQYFALVGYALSLYDTPLPIEGIGLGIPPGIYSKEKAKATKEMFQGVKIRCNKKPIILPSNIEFIPQGVGAYISWISKNPSGKDLNTVVVDIGYYTVDLVYLNKGKYIPDFSRSFPFGVESLLDRLRDKFAVKYGEFITSRVAEDLLQTGRIVHFGKEYTMNSERDYLINKFYIEELMKIIKNYSTNIKDAGYLAQNVIICGGGARYFPPVTGAIVMENPQFANAEGYRLYVEQISRAVPFKLSKS